MKKFFHLIPFILLNTILHAQYTSKLVQTGSNKYELIIKNHITGKDTLTIIKHLSYTVFKLRQADIDKDGEEEIILGVHKITRLDSIERNRINIYSIDSNKIVAKWLGSFLPHPLYDFELTCEDGIFYILTIELEQNNLYLVSKYEWHSFGLKYVCSLKRNIGLNEALNLLINPYEKE